MSYFNKRAITDASLLLKAFETLIYLDLINHKQDLPFCDTTVLRYKPRLWFLITMSENHESSKQ